MLERLSTVGVHRGSRWDGRHEVVRRRGGARTDRDLDAGLCQGRGLWGALAAQSPSSVLAADDQPDLASGSASISERDDELVVVGDRLHRLQPRGGNDAEARHGRHSVGLNEPLSLIGEERRGLCDRVAGGGAPQLPRRVDIASGDCGHVVARHSEGFGDRQRVGRWPRRLSRGHSRGHAAPTDQPEEKKKAAGDCSRIRSPAHPTSPDPTVSLSTRAAPP
jgi:hypothetical protein